MCRTLGEFKEEDLFGVRRNFCLVKSCFPTVKPAISPFEHKVFLNTVHHKMP